ncbi:MAG: AmmeMemoRadiSam system protein B [Nitrospinae bacterium]|nr:AmmeMemoRadiSam system protein B [Nitrospinota bacterium]
MESPQNIRPPAVAGMFYPADPKAMLDELRGYIGAAPEGHAHPLAAVSPHAGWYYSGHVAGAVFAAIDVPDRVILIGPNHRGRGAELALDPHGAWRFPSGDVPVDKELGGLLLRYCPLLEEDAAAHAAEHSLEVIVPFLHAKNRDVKIAPLCIGTHNPEKLASLAAAVARAAKETGALVVASSDMTHYLSDKAARAIDGKMIETLKSLDADEILDAALEDQALCGAGPVYVAVAAARENGAREFAVVRYATSGDIEGKRDAVVGYGGFVIS